MTCKFVVAPHSGRAAANIKGRMQYPVSQAGYGQALLRAERAKDATVMLVCDRGNVPLYTCINGSCKLSQRPKLGPIKAVIAGARRRRSRR